MELMRDFYEDKGSQMDLLAHFKGSQVEVVGVLGINSVRSYLRTKRNER